MAHKRVQRHGPDIFGKNREQWLSEGRAVARKLLRNRQSITIEDVLEVHPLPVYLHHNTIGRLLNGQGDFVAIGYTVARKPSSKGRVIRRWALKHPTEPPQRIHVRGEYDSGD